MKAILPANEVSNASQPQNKETTDTRVVIGCKGNKMQELITVRWYMGRSNSASTVYCCVWLHGKSYWISGKGTAGGYGYHKTSAAFQDALNSAGIKLVGNPYMGMEKTYIQHERQEDGTFKQVEYKQNFRKDCSISGCGDRAIDNALKAVAFELGYSNVYISRG